MATQRMHGSELIIAKDGTLYHIGLKRADNPPRNIFLVGDPARVQRVCSHLSEAKEIAREREYVTAFGKYKGDPVMVMGTGIGTDNVEIASVELHALFEFDHERNAWADEPVKLNMIRLGTSGSPQRDVAIGSVAVSTHGIGLDNTGVYYPYFTLDPVAREFATRLRYRIEEWIMDSDLAEICPSAAAAKEAGLMNEAGARSYLIDLIKPYVSPATPEVVLALSEACRTIGCEAGGRENGFHVGATSSASGFFGPQGRQVGRLNIAIPRLQQILAELSANGVWVVNNEMESSAMFRINGEILGHNVGTICAVIANRAEGEFVTPELYGSSVDHAIRAGLEAMRILASQR